MEDRENICRRCGSCCHAKIIVEDEVYCTGIPCPYLDTDTNLCTIYERRFEVNQRCLTVEKGIAARVFPADCPYVQGLEGYRPPKSEEELANKAGLDETDLAGGAVTSA